MKRKKLSKNSKKPVALNFKFSDLFSADYRIVTALLIILPLLIYTQVYNFEFVWDEITEPINHFKNPFVEHPSWVSFTQLFTQPFFAMYIPVSYLFWGLLKSLAELLSLPINSIFHLSNVVLHIINGLLVFTILKQFVVNKWAVLLGVGFFLLHPIQVEAVAWVSEFRSLLATLFALLSCYYYLKKSAKLSYLALIFFVLAALSKPSAVVLVPFVFLLNYFHYGFKLGKNIQKTLPFALIALIFVIIAHSVQSKFNIYMSEYALAFWQRPFAWLDSIVFYLYKIIYPYHLSSSYTLSPKFISPQWWFYPLALMPAGLGYFLWLRRKTQPLLVFAAALFIAGFFTTSGFVDFSFQKHSLVADRYIYFAMIGTALVVANLADRKYWRVLLLGVLLIFTALSTFRQIPVWQNPIKLWSHAINYEITPSYAHEDLATNFNNTGIHLSKLKQYQQAQLYFDKAIKLYPKKNPEAIGVIYNKGLSYLRQKKYQQALDSFNQVIKINPNNVNANNGKIDALTSLVKHFSDKGREFANEGKYRQAIVYFDKAINITPPNNKKYLAILFSDKGRAFASMGKYQQAADSFDKEIKHYPQDDISDRGTAFYNKGLALFKLKKHNQALEHFNQAIKINPTNAAAHNANIDVLIIIKQCKKAKQAFAFAQQHKVKLQEEIAKNLHKVCP